MTRRSISTLVKAFFAVAVFSLMFIGMGQQTAQSAACAASSHSANVAFLPISCPTPTPLPPQAPDDRTNWVGGDHVAVTYVRQNENGTLRLDVYGVNSSGAGQLELSVEVSTYADYIGNPPAENTLIASGANVEVYILNTGELQVNITEPGSGKVYVTLYNLETLAVIGGYVITP